MMRGAVATGLLALSGMALAGGTEEAPTSAPVSAVNTSRPAPTDAAALWRLVQRMGVAELYVKQLPPEWDVPLPAGAELLGASGYPSSWNVYLESDQPVAAVREFYKQQPGWELKEERSGWRNGGFISTAVDGIWSEEALVFVRSTPPAVVRVMAVPEVVLTDGGVEAGTTSLTVALQRGEEAVKALADGPMFDPLTELMPKLYAPSTVTVNGMGSSSSDDWATQNARLETSLTAAQLEQIYAVQLKEQGWTLQTRLPAARADEAHTLWYHPADTKDGKPQSARFLTLNLARREAGSYAASLKLWLP